MMLASPDRASFSEGWRVWSSLRLHGVLCVLGLSMLGCALDRGPIFGNVVEDGGLTVRDGGSDMDAAGDVDAASNIDAGAPVDSGVSMSDASCTGPELCDGVDNDCDSSSEDGADEAWLGMPCDGTDSDLCSDGTLACVDGEMRCDDAADDAVHMEICDGLDNDCDSATLDGSADALLGVSCDGTDADLCEEAILSCVSGALFCNDSVDDDAQREICDGIDNDCDPMTIDGLDDGEVGVSCDGTDLDLCEDGVQRCVSGTMVCQDNTDDPTHFETCDGIDNDCDGAVDEEGGCICERHSFSGHSYLFCDELREWTEARRICRDVGYDLVSINSLAEQNFIHTEASAITRTGSWWVSLNDLMSEGNFVWADGTDDSRFNNWNSAEPNNLGGEDCVEMWVLWPGAAGVDGGWNDRRCSTRRRFACEAGP